MPLSREDFARWREDPVTRAVLEAHRRISAECQSAWVKASWDGGACSKELLGELRTRADAYDAIAGMTFEGLCETLGEEPRDE